MKYEKRADRVSYRASKHIEKIRAKYHDWGLAQDIDDCFDELVGIVREVINDNECLRDGQKMKG